MKQLFLIIVCVIPFSTIGMDEPRQLLSLSESHKRKHIGYEPLYQLLSIQDFGRLAQVNKQFLDEIGYIGATQFKDINETAARTLYGSKDVGSDPRVDIYFIDVFREGKTFQIKQERLVAHWLRNIFAPALLSVKEKIIAEDKIAQGFNNYIIFKPSNGDSTMVCLEDQSIQPSGPFNPLMTIYSIDHIDSWNEIELDAIINKEIKIPLFVIFEGNVLKRDEAAIRILYNQFKKSQRRNDDDFSLCASSLWLHFDLYSWMHKDLKEANQDKANKLNDVKNSMQN